MHMSYALKGLNQGLVFGSTKTNGVHNQFHTKFFNRLMSSEPFPNRKKSDTNNVIYI